MKPVSLKVLKKSTALLSAEGILSLHKIKEPLQCTRIGCSRKAYYVLVTYNVSPQIQKESDAIVIPLCSKHIPKWMRMELQRKKGGRSEQ